MAPYVLTTLYPDAGEAVVCTVFPRPEPDPDIEVAPPTPPDPEACWRRANSRARSRSRRYIVANRLRFMWVLTLAGEGLHGPEGRAEVMAATGRLVRRLRAAQGDEPMWWSPELHPDGHGWHVNLFVRRYVRHAAMGRMWQGGHVWVKDWSRDSRVAGATFVERLRAGATYGAKYAAKDWDAVQLAGGAHRYEVTQGHEPVAVLAEVRSVAEGVRLAVVHLGRAGHVWRSADEDEWDGPECAVVFAVAARPPPRRHPPPVAAHVE